MQLTPINLKNASPAELQYREKIVKALEKNKWNVTAAAAEIGLSRMSLYRRVKILSIPLPKTRRGRSIFDHKF